MKRYTYALFLLALMTSFSTAIQYQINTSAMTNAAPITTSFAIFFNTTHDILLNNVTVGYNSTLHVQYANGTEIKTVTNISGVPASWTVYQINQPLRQGNTYQILLDSTGVQNMLYNGAETYPITAVGGGIVVINSAAEGTNYTDLVRGFRYIDYHNITILPLAWHSSYCYQETANKSNSCGGLSTGTYGFEGTYQNPVTGEYWENQIQAYDESYLTYATHFEFPNTSFMSINYTIPNRAYNYSWQVKSGDDVARFDNLTLYTNCTLNNNIVLKTEAYYEGIQGVLFWCGGGLGNDTYVGWGGFPGAINHFLYEEGIWWYLNDTITENYTGQYNTTISSASYPYNSTFTINGNYTNVTTKINLNGTWYTASNNGSLASTNISMPYINTTEILTGYWFYNVTWLDGTYTELNGSSFSQTLTGLYIYDCSNGSTTNPIIRLFFYDEDTNDAIVNDTIKHYYQVWISNLSSASTFYFNTTLNNSNNFTLCGTNSTSYYVNGIIKYSRQPEYDARDYFIINFTPTGSVTNYSLYLANNTKTLLTKFNLKQNNLNPAGGYYLYINRFFPELATYKLVTIGLTDDNGIYTTPLEAPEPYYRIVVTNGYSIIDNFSQILIPYTSCTDTCAVNLIMKSGALITNTSVIYGYRGTGSCSMNYTSNVTTCSFLDTSSTPQSINFTVYNLSNGNAIVCTQALSTASATFTCSLGTLSSNQYKTLLKIQYSDTAESTLDTIFVNVKGIIQRNLGLIGLFIAVIISLGLALVKMDSPRTSLAMFAVGLAFSAALGLISADNNFSSVMLGGAVTVALVAYAVIRD